MSTILSVPSAPPAIDVNINSPGPAPGTIEAYCKERLDMICAVVDGTAPENAIPKLRAVMASLEYSKIDIENDIASKARQERIRAHRRIEKSRRELRKAHRHLMNVELQAQHIESKIKRLSEYSAFIENKWRDDTNNNNNNKNTSNTNEINSNSDKKGGIDKVQVVAGTASAPS